MNNCVLDKEIIKITPNSYDLLPRKQLQCLLCENYFFNAGNLQMHLARHHKYFSDNKSRRLEALPKEVDENKYIKFYFCPVENCIYNERVFNGGRHFTNIKYIRQHFQKVHMEKCFKCLKCSKTFTTITSQNVHELICGKKFECKTCKKNYTTNEALLTHIKRKNHEPFEYVKKNHAKVADNKAKVLIPRFKYKNDKIKRQSKDKAYSRCTKKSKEKIQYLKKKIVPDKFKINRNQYVYLIKVAFEAKDQECQTDFESRVTNPFTSNNNSIVDNISIKEMNENNQMKMITQQKYSKIRENHEHFSRYYEGSCFNQLVNESNLCDIETQTETSSVLDELLHHSHTYTQTCDDFFQELCLSDIQTQTNLSISINKVKKQIDLKNTNVADNYHLNGIYEKKHESNPIKGITGAHDELLVSTETQTSFTQCLLEVGENESITNANSCITQYTQTDQLLLHGLFESQDDSDFNFQSTQTQT